MGTFPNYSVDYSTINAETWIPKLTAILPAELSSVSNNYDSFVIITHNIEIAKTNIATRKFSKDIDLALEANATINSSVQDIHIIPTSKAPGKRLILAITGRIDRYIDDVRVYQDTALKAMKKVVASGSINPLVIVIFPDKNKKYRHAGDVAIGSALGSVWEPLESREFKPLMPHIKNIGWILKGNDSSRENVDTIRAIELGKFLSRDITGTEPERMSAPKLAELVEKEFKGSSVKVSVESDFHKIDNEYPLIGAVARASKPVERHHPRIIRLEYRPAGNIERTIFLNGKGLTYDTGGADLKTGGHMTGMSRDKGGAGSVLGIMRTLAVLKPEHVAVVAYVGAVRNSIGSESFVTDEIINSRAGVRVRIGNTDAEGRLVLCDLLAKSKEDAISAKNPIIFSVATLTGHSYRAYGPYPIAIENGVAAQHGFVKLMEEIGASWGEPFEHSIVRREDYAFVANKTSAEDVISCNSEASVNTARGHQFPMAFLDIASGLINHDIGSDRELPFIHIDIGGSGVEGGSWAFGRPSGSSILNLLTTFIL